MKVDVDVRRLALYIARSGRRFVTLKDIEYRLAVSRVTAGKLLAEMVRMGVARRYSSRAYEILFPANVAVKPIRYCGDEHPEEAEEKIETPIER